MYQYYNPYLQQAGQNPYAQPQISTNQYNQQIVRVNGENGARAFQMMANASAILLDENEPIVWLVQSDGAGYKTVTPYKIEPYTKPEPQNMDTILRRIERLEDIINGESNSTDVRTENAGTKHSKPDKSGKGGS